MWCCISEVFERKLNALNDDESLLKIFAIEKAIRIRSNSNRDLLFIVKINFQSFTITKDMQHDSMLDNKLE